VQRIGDQLVLSPTDLTKHLACAHVTTLDQLVADGALAKPALDDESLELIFRLGLAHERSYLEALRDEGRSIAEIPTAFDDEGRRQGEAATLVAMHAGVDVVYQATFYDGRWGGQADFLLRVELPSALGRWSYEIADTKLARRLTVPALLQMAIYAQRLAVLQGAEPQYLYVVTGDGERRPWRLVDVAAFARRARSRLDAAIELGAETLAVPVGHCGQCRWLDRCSARWRRADDLCLVAFMRADHRVALMDAGVATLAALAVSEPDELPTTIGRSSRGRLVSQAAQQLDERNTGVPSYTLLPPVEGTGLVRLPAPDEGDLYLDFEGDPYAEGGDGREYLAGVGDRSGEFTALWAHDRDAERVLTEQLIDLLVVRWQEHPGMHIYHYAPYETAALKRLTTRHGVREAELDQLLRGERFVDLYAVVRQGLRISKASYSIKKMEAFYWGAIRNHNQDVADALSSVIAYERWMVEPDDTTLGQIKAYNHDDVRSTHDLHVWLEHRRGDLEAVHGPQLRPEEVQVDPGLPLGEAERYELDLAGRLRDEGQELMASLVQWHRREARPAWWEVFRLGDLDDDELVDDAAAIGRLSGPVTIGTVKRSKLYEYRFPAQDTRLRVGDSALDIDTHAAIGEVVELDPVEGRIVVKRAKEPVAARGLGPPGPISDGVLREAIHATAEALLTGRDTLGQALLERRVPLGTATQPEEAPNEAVIRVGRSLDGQVLAVQGPPGSGKTTVGAALIRALLDDGKTVGVTATSHAVIGNLLGAVGRPGLQKCEPDQHCGSAHIAQTTSNATVADALANGDVRLVGATAWLWARSDMAGSVDVLVVDEAGQFALANATAVARGARALVLLGDPQQLTQPTQAVHPAGAGASVLEHFLDGHDTVPSDRGVFLDTSWRMHPTITDFISTLAYDGRLQSAAGRDQQEVISSSVLTGHGLRMVPVEHTGMSAASPVEADAVAGLWRGLQGAIYRDHDGQEHVMGETDVLIVAPYNNQVSLIKERLSPAARVGTVDKFQGQQAPVVIYSMTSSSAHDAPRGISFLYDLHRLNVAVSRAKAIAVIVMSPTLLDAAVNNPEQLRRVNSLCRFAEHAGPAPNASSADAQLASNQPFRRRLRR
jgi:predicted RecB family nuclease